MSKKLWLSGVSGYVASNVAKHILETTDWNIIAPVSMDHQGNQKRIQTLLSLDPSYPSRVTVVPCDLSMRFDADLFGRCDVVWNFAAHSHVDTSLQDPVGVFRNNAMSSVWVTEYVKETKPEYFAYFNTDEVFGDALSGEAHREWSPHRPSNPYASGKAAASDYAYSAWRSADIPLVMTWGMNIIGGGPKGLDQHEEKYLPKIAKAIRDGSVLEVHADPNGASGGRHWVNVKDIATAYMKIYDTHKDDPNLKFLPNRPRTPVGYNIAGVKMTNLEIAQRMAHLTGRELRYELVDAHSQRAGHDVWYGLDNTKLHSIGWEQTVSIDETLLEVAGSYGLTRDSRKGKL